MMADFVHEIDISAGVEAVRRLIAHHGDEWWTTNAVIDGEEGGICNFRFPDAGFEAGVRVLKNTPDLVEWRCISSIQSANTLSANGGTDPQEWVGTTIRFELSAAAADVTHLRLRHLGLGASATYYSTKNNVWAYYLASLKKLAETGKGDPYQGGRPTPDAMSIVPTEKVATAADIVRQFYDAAVARDLAKARTFLADDLVFVGLFETYRSADDYIKAFIGLLQITIRLQVKTIIAQADEAAVFFELETKVPAEGIVLVAEWHQIRKGKIAHVESAFDGRPFAAMFASGQSQHSQT